MNEEIFMRSARQRAVSLGLPYAGALTPNEACEYARSVEGAVIVDVRTSAELKYVGRIPGALEVEWQLWPSMEVNSRFLEELKASGVKKNQSVLFICRSGARSHNAALAAQSDGYHTVFNVLEGFEGDLDVHQHRNKVGGWRFYGLPWEQA